MKRYDHANYPVENKLIGRRITETIREPQFQAIPGLIQKYYTKMDEPGKFGGVYVWDSMESLQVFRTSELAASIPQAYELVEPPTLETLDVLFQLRD